MNEIFFQIEFNWIICIIKFIKTIKLFVLIINILKSVCLSTSGLLQNQYFYIIYTITNYHII